MHKLDTDLRQHASDACGLELRKAAICMHAARATTQARTGMQNQQTAAIVRMPSPMWGLCWPLNVRHAAMQSSHVLAMRGSMSSAQPKQISTP